MAGNSTKTETPVASISETLKERGARYGYYWRHALITQNIKAAMIDSPNWDKLQPFHKEALDMIAHKIGRILNGDPNYIDSWHDIIGYAQLVEDHLHEQEAMAQISHSNGNEVKLEKDRNYGHVPNLESKS